jgi:hypothetical protein
MRGSVNTWQPPAFHNFFHAFWVISKEKLKKKKKKRNSSKPIVLNNLT